MSDSLRTAAAAAVAAGLVIAAAVTSMRPAGAASSDRCTYVRANEPHAAIATAWHRLGGQNGPLGCPSAPERGGSQTFQHGTISHPAGAAQTTAASYLRGGRLHVAITSLGEAHDRYQIASERGDGSSQLWTVAGGSSASFVTDVAQTGGAPFRIKIYTCEAHTSVFTAAAYVCDRSARATAVSAPLELSMDPLAPRVAPTGAVALK